MSIWQKIKISVGISGFFLIGFYALGQILSRILLT